MARTKARYEQMQALKAQGKGIKPIMRELELATETVRKFYSVDELLAKPRGGRPSVLDAYKAYLHERWNTGCTNASTLHREITEQGYTLKSITTVLTATPRPPGPWIAPALMET